MDGCADEGQRDREASDLIPENDLSGPISLRDFYDALPVGVCIIDRDLRCISLNTAMAQLADRPAGEMLGRGFAQVIPGGGDAFEERLHQVLAGQQSEDLQVQAAFPGSMPGGRSLLVSFGQLYDQNGATACVLCVVHDITRLKRAGAGYADVTVEDGAGAGRPDPVHR